MEIRVVSSQTTIVDGKAVISEQTEKVLTAAEINNLIGQENQRQINIKAQMTALKTEYDKSIAAVANYQNMLSQISTEPLPTV